MIGRVRIAAVQTDPKITENTENLNKVLLESKVPAQNGADLIVFPECALTGYVFSSREKAMPFTETIPGASTDRLSTAINGALTAYLAGRP